MTREIGGNFAKSKQWQAEAPPTQIIAPRMQVYWVVELAATARRGDIRADVREAKARGADGLKIFGMDRDQLEATMDEAKAQSLKTTTHIAVEETTAKDFVELGVDFDRALLRHRRRRARRRAALPGRHELQQRAASLRPRRRALCPGESREAEQVLDLMVAKKVAWSPTLSIYEASRDVDQRAEPALVQGLPAPGAARRSSQPNLANHGSYFAGWTNTQEARWRQQYRIWMDALREFGVKGGVITTGDDAGFIHSLYGFGLMRELELHEEAGFHPLDVIKHGTVNGAHVLGMGDKLGSVRQGFSPTCWW